MKGHAGSRPDPFCGPEIDCLRGGGHIISLLPLNPVVFRRVIRNRIIKKLQSLVGRCDARNRLPIAKVRCCLDIVN
jgi:hypothetical protein